MGTESDMTTEEVEDRRDDRLVCLCYKLTEGQIVEAIQGGANSMQKLAERLKVAGRCEGCVMDALELLQMHASGFDWNSREQLHIEGDLPYHSRAAQLASRLLPRSWFRKLMDYVDVGHFMTTIWLAGPDISTRVFVSNHASPYFPRQSGIRRVRVSIYDKDGNVLHEKESRIRLGATLLVDVGEALGKRNSQELEFGALDIKILPTSEVPYIFHGSLRAYTQWYNSDCLTQVHEQFARNEYGSYDRDHHGYATFPEVLGGKWRTWMAVFNNRRDALDAEWVLFANDGSRRRAPLRLGARETVLATPQQVFGDDVVNAALEEGSATVYLDRSVALTHFYLNHNRDEQLWQAQHL